MFANYDFPEVNLSLLLASPNRCPCKTRAEKTFFIQPDPG